VPAVDSQQCLLHLTDRTLGTTDAGDQMFSIIQCQVRSDLDGNCFVDLADFAILASE